MPFSRIVNNDGGIILIASGLFTDNDLIDLHKVTYIDDEQIKQIPYMVLDVSNIERNEISNSQIIRNAKIDSHALSINPRMRLAILARRDVEFGLGRMWEIYACEIPGNDKGCNVFRNRDELIKWIQYETKQP